LSSPECFYDKLASENIWIVPKIYCHLIIMKTSTPRLPDLTRRSFARTNAETIAQRVVLLDEFVPGVGSIAEICCGDCSRQHKVYTSKLGVRTFRGLDLEPAIIAALRAKGIDCYLGNALDMI
jgi:hypothetical protein